MKEIDQFFESIKNLYKKILSEDQDCVTHNFVKTQPTTTIPFSHYRFYLKNEEIDNELVALLVDERLSNGEIYTKDSKNFVVVSELALQECCEERAGKMLTNFDNAIKKLLLLWSPENKLQLEKIIHETNNLGVVRFTLSYGTFPPVIIVTGDVKILGAIHAFLLTNNVVSTISKQSTGATESKRTFVVNCAQQGLDLLPRITKFILAFTASEDISRMRDSLLRYEQQQTQLRHLLQTMSEKNADPNEIINHVSECLGVSVKRESSGFNPGFLIKRSLETSDENVGVKRNKNNNKGDKGLAALHQSFSLNRSV